MNSRNYAFSKIRNKCCKVQTNLFQRGENIVGADVEIKH